MIGEDEKAEEILNQLEGGVIDVEEAVRRLTGEEEATPRVKAESPQVPRRWRAWWLIPFSIGLGLTAAGAGVATLGGWWWLCAGSLLLIGISILTLAAVTSRSPWVHVRVDTGQESWPRRIAISLPLPIRFTAWVLRVFGPWVNGLDQTAIDELLLALDEGVFSEGPIFVEVDEDTAGEKVQVYFG
jgi:hypothetical protein